MAAVPRSSLSKSVQSRPVSFASADKGDITIGTPDLAEPDDIERTRFTDVLLGRRKVVDPDAIATKRCVYDDPALAKHYWPKDDYENIHRFDPAARWTYREEQVITFRQLPQQQI
jgi:hypothetical protein